MYFWPWVPKIDDHAKCLKIKTGSGLQVDGARSVKIGAPGKKATGRNNGVNFKPSCSFQIAKEFF